MARARLLKPGFFQNESLAELPFEARLTFAGLWTLADREGRLEDRPKRIKAALFPWDDVEINDILAGLCREGFIARYEAEGVAVIQIVKFLEHQKPHKHEQDSKLPPLSPQKQDVGGADYGSRPAVSKTVPKTESKSVSSRSAGADASPTVIVFPCDGKTETWELTESQIETWQLAYPRIDVLSECVKAHVWVEANPGRRKTAGGMAKFLVGWLNRSKPDQQPKQASEMVGAARDMSWQQECFRDHDGECGSEYRHAQRLQLDAMRAGAA